MSDVLANYTDFDYKAKFWGAGREYEDQCDRLALRKLLPKTGEKIADICGGFGRLISEYLGKFQKVYLFDYAQNLLDQAKKEYGDKIIVNQGQAEKLPYASGEMDVAVFVRASHHFKDIEKVVSELSRIVKPHGYLILEAANKRHIVQIIRWLLKRSDFNPFDQTPVSRNDKGFYNYHPKYMEALLKKYNLKVKKVLAVSNFRSNLLKKIFGPGILIKLENMVQAIGGLFKLSPSIYYLAEKNA